MISLDADIVIVGSGAGGGAVARALAPLARDGLRILLFEQGARLDDHEFTGREIEMADALYEDGGGFLTADGTMIFLRYEEDVLDRIMFIHGRLSLDGLELHELQFRS